MFLLVSVILFTVGSLSTRRVCLLGGLPTGGICLLGGILSRGCLDGYPTVAIAAVGTHPTGMHSCFVIRKGRNIIPVYDFR